MVMSVVKKFYLVLNTACETYKKLGFGIDEDFWESYKKEHGKLPSVKEVEKNEKFKFKAIMKEVGIDVKDFKIYDGTALTPLEYLVGYEVLLEEDVPYGVIEKKFVKHFGTTTPLWKEKHELPHSSSGYASYFGR
jgi:hypothetical protein